MYEFRGFFVSCNVMVFDLRSMSVHVKEAASIFLMPVKRSNVFLLILLKKCSAKQNVFL